MQSRRRKKGISKGSPTWSWKPLGEPVLSLPLQHHSGTLTMISAWVLHPSHSPLGMLLGVPHGISSKIFACSFGLPRNLSWNIFHINSTFFCVLRKRINHSDFKYHGLSQTLESQLCSFHKNTNKTNGSILPFTKCWIVTPKNSLVWHSGVCLATYKILLCSSPSLTEIPTLC